MIEIADPQDAFTNAASHILRVRITPDHPVQVRRGRTLAQRGALVFAPQQEKSGDELTDDVEDRQRIRGLAFVKGTYARLRPAVGAAVTAGGNLYLKRASGEGEIFLGRNGGDITVFRVDDPALIVLEPAEVLAHSDTLTATLVKNTNKKLAVAVDATHAWTFNGHGDLATATSGEVIVLGVTPEQPVLVETEAILAMSSGIRLTPPENYTSKIVERGIGKALKLLPTNIDLGHRRVWMVADGTGQVVVRSSD